MAKLNFEILEDHNLMESFPEPKTDFDAKKFVLAGKAIFTIRSKKTGTRFTYKVSKGKDNLWFVGLLSGPDNNADYQYIGIITSDKKFIRTKRSKVGYEAPSFKAFSWFFSHLSNFEKQADIYHEGRCGRCGRRLTVPESIESGFGPECINKV